MSLFFLAQILSIFFTQFISKVSRVVVVSIKKVEYVVYFHVTPVEIESE